MHVGVCVVRESGGSLVVPSDGAGMGSWWGLMKRISSKTHLKLINSKGYTSN